MKSFYSKPVLMYLGLSILLNLSVVKWSMAQPNIKTQGIEHIGLSVTKLKETTAFFTQQLGWQLLGEDPTYPATFVSDGHQMISLWQITEPNNAVPFDRKKNVGLHHLAILVDSFASLDLLHEKLLGVPGVVIEFPPELAYGGPAKHMMIIEPSGNRLELKHNPR